MGNFGNIHLSYLDNFHLMEAAFKQKADKLTYTNEQFYINYYYQYK